MGARTRRWRRALEVTRVARRSGLLRVLGEIGVVGDRPASREGAVEFRRALEELGTTYIKLGQLLSSRPDLLPDVYIDELGKLVDEVPPVPFDQIRRVIDSELGLDVFAEIDPEPLATASIAQIHRALLKSGRDVVVKVRRPGIVEQVELDLDLIRSTARLLEGRSMTAQILQLEALADELETYLRAERNFEEEASNAEIVRRVLADYEHLVVPEVIRPYVTEQVLVLERIEGDKVTPDHGLAPERARELARELFPAYVKQVTIDGIYHADPHRGNVLLTPDGRLALVDFGLLGRLDEDTRRQIGLLLLAVAQNRADDLADIILSLSLTTITSDEAGFVHELRRKLPRYHWRPLKDMRAGESLADLQRMAVRYEIRMPIALMEEDALVVLLTEAERRLEPNQLLAWLYTQAEPLARMPRRVGHLVERLETGTIKVGIAPTALGDLERIVRSAANRVGSAMIVAALLIASALLARVHDLRWFAFAGFALSFLLGLYMVWKIIRTPGEL
jgi:ubiquinone biosynthesis protein